MPIAIPQTRAEVTGRIKSDVQGNLPESNPYLRNSFLQALIFGMSGRLFDIYKTESLIIDLLFWDTTTDEYLERAAAIFGITRNAATSSEGYFTIGGTDGTDIPLGTTFQTSDGLEVETQALATITDTTVSISSLTQSGGVATATTSASHLLAAGINVTIAGANETEYNGTFEITNVTSLTQFQFTVDSGASSPATGTITANHVTASVQSEAVDQGEDTNLDNGAPLTITSAISGVNDTGYAQYEGFQGGADTEEDDDFRDRFLFRVRNPVSLFNEAAIELKAKEITGVTRVFIFNVDDTARTGTASTLTQSGNIATFTATASHGLVDGQKVTVTGADQAEYNVVTKSVLVIDSTKFCYVITGSPASPATGTITATFSTVEEGDVKIFFVRDNDDSIIPSSTEIDDVKTNILTIKPAHTSDDSVEVKAPTALTVPFNFTSITPDTTTMQTAIGENLAAFFQEGTSVARNLTENQYESAIFNTVDPSTGDKLTDFVLSTPTGDLSIGYEELPVLGDVTFA